ncbi:hypothetical protein CLOP_g4635 [Closterium sp. NIES-67]|nr:hypothetical protein CLOP_g4635 [Closterium sp. NIES-67]
MAADIRREDDSASRFSCPSRPVTGAEAVTPATSPPRSFARRVRHQRSWSVLLSSEAPQSLWLGSSFEFPKVSRSGRPLEFSQPSRSAQSSELPQPSLSGRSEELPRTSFSGLSTSRLYELTLDTPPNQELLFVPATSSKKAARALNADGGPEVHEEPSSPGWADLKAQCELMDEENRRITSVNLTHIPHGNLEGEETHSLCGDSRRRGGKDADGVIMYGLGWQPCSHVEASHIKVSDVKKPEGWRESEAVRRHAGIGKSHRRQQSCPTDYCAAGKAAGSDLLWDERGVEREGEGIGEQWQPEWRVGDLSGRYSRQRETVPQQQDQGQQQQQQQQQEEEDEEEEREQQRHKQGHGVLSLFATWHSRTRSRHEEFQSAVSTLSPTPSPPLPTLTPSPPLPTLTPSPPPPHPPSLSLAPRHRRSSSGVLQPTYMLRGWHKQAREGEEAALTPSPPPPSSLAPHYCRSSSGVLQPTFAPRGRPDQARDGEEEVVGRASGGRRGLQDGSADEPGAHSFGSLHRYLGSPLNPVPRRSASDDNALSLRSPPPIHCGQPFSEAPSSQATSGLGTHSQGLSKQGLFWAGCIQAV